MIEALFKALFEPMFDTVGSASLGVLLIMFVLFLGNESTSWEGRKYTTTPTITTLVVIQAIRSLLFEVDPTHFCRSIMFNGRSAQTKSNVILTVIMGDQKSAVQHSAPAAKVITADSLAIFCCASRSPASQRTLIATHKPITVGNSGFPPRQRVSTSNKPQCCLPAPVALFAIHRSAITISTSTMLRQGETIRVHGDLRDL